MRLARDELSTSGVVRLINGINRQAINDLEKGNRKQKKDANNYIKSNWCIFINSIITKH